MDEVDRAQVAGDLWLEHHLRLARTVAAEGNGKCQECGEPIPEARLQAVPGAPRCIDCQTALETARP